MQPRFRSLETHEATHAQTIGQKPGRKMLAPSTERTWRTRLTDFNTRQRFKY